MHADALKLRNVLDLGHLDVPAAGRGRRRSGCRRRRRSAGCLRCKTGSRWRVTAEPASDRSARCSEGRQACTRAGGWSSGEDARRPSKARHHAHGLHRLPKLQLAPAIETCDDSRGAACQRVPPDAQRTGRMPFDPQRPDEAPAPARACRLPAGSAGTRADPQGKDPLLGRAGASPCFVAEVEGGRSNGGQSFARSGSLCQPGGPPRAPCSRAHRQGTADAKPWRSHSRP